jgi:GNAT superfamily N-acetyltransferase
MPQRLTFAVRRAGPADAARIAGGEPDVLGFSSHAVESDEHRTAVYVRSTATRHGVGSALFKAAEAGAIDAGAASLHVDASLAAVEFYRANGFEEIGRGEHRLPSGRSMPCVFMRKNLRRGPRPDRHRQTTASN